jgi:nitrogen fixation NifU-like protein
MDRQAQIEFLLDHYENPRNRRKIEDPDIMMSWGNPGCGDVLTLYLKIDEAERIAEISFEGEGCTVSQASASILTEKLEGQPLAYAEALSPEDIMSWVGREVMLTRRAAPCSPFIPSRSPSGSTGAICQKNRSRL